MQKQGRVCDLGMPLKRTNLVLILDFNHSFKLLSFGKNLESDPTLVFDPSLVCALYILNSIMKSQCMTVMPGTLKMAYLKYMLYFTVKKKKKSTCCVSAANLPTVITNFSIFLGFFDYSGMILRNCTLLGTKFSTNSLQSICCTVISAVWHKNRSLHL